MNALFAELCFFFIPELVNMILSYSHIPAKSKLYHQYQFDRTYSKNLEALIRHITFLPPGKLYFNFLLLSTHKRFYKYSIQERNLQNLCGRGTREGLGRREYQGVSFHYIYKNPCWLLLYSASCRQKQIQIQVHPLSLGSYCFYKSYVYFMDTWIGCILEYKIFVEAKTVSLLKKIDVSSTIRCSRYFHAIQVKENIIAVSGHDSLFLFDHFGSEIVTLDFPGKDPGFLLHNKFLYLIIQDMFHVYQLS